MRNTWKLYEMLNRMKKGRLRIIRFNMGWSEKKTKKHLRKLLKDKLIKEENGIYYPLSVKELINWDEMNSKPEDYNFNKEV